MSKRFSWFLLLVVTFAVASMQKSHAQVVHEDPGYYAQASLLWKRSRDEDEQMNLFVQSLYTEKKFSERASGFMYAYRDDEFYNVVVGPAFRFSEHVQLGIAPGIAHFDGRSRPMLMVWTVYTVGSWEALVTHEWYGKTDRSERHYMKGYIKKKLSDHWSVGIHAENDYGAGPAVWYTWGKWTFSIAHAMAYRPTHGGVQTIFLVSYEVGQ